jgi:hypothetical protein
MPDSLYASVDGHRLTAARLTVSNIGPWIADVDFEGSPDLAGRVRLTIGALALEGTLVATQSGVFGLQRRARIVAGAGAWADDVAAKQYHNDAGVKALTIAEDAARAVGETLGTLVPAAERVGRDYARQVGPASRALEDALGGVAWWVDYAGVTHAGPRPAKAVPASAYTVLAYDPRDRTVDLGVNDPAKLTIGAMLVSDRLDEPVTIRELRLTVTASTVRAKAWCGGTEGGYGHLAGLLRSIVQRSTDGQLWGHYRYRVVAMAGTRVELQAVRQIVGLPDLLPLSIWPGIAGAHAELAPGAEVLVGFIEGDRAQPVVLAFAGADGPGFVPTSLTLGGTEGAPVARRGDVVEMHLPPGRFQGTVNGQPAPPMDVLGTIRIVGTIIGGSEKVRIG